MLMIGIKRFIGITSCKGPMKTYRFEGMFPSCTKVRASCIWLQLSFMLSITYYNSMLNAHELQDSAQNCQPLPCTQLRMMIPCIFAWLPWGDHLLAWRLRHGPKHDVTDKIRYSVSKGTQNWREMGWRSYTCFPVRAAAFIYRNIKAVWRHYGAEKPDLPDNMRQYISIVLEVCSQQVLGPEKHVQAARHGVIPWTADGRSSCCKLVKDSTYDWPQRCNPRQLWLLGPGCSKLAAKAEYANWFWYSMSIVGSWLFCLRAKAMIPMDSFWAWSSA